MFAAFGRSTSTVSRTMKLAVTMKMISSTRVMSTSGVTLIPTISSSLSLCAAPAISSLPLAAAAQVRDQRVPQRVGARGDGLQRAGEQVVANDRGDRDGEADRGRHQRFGNARHDRLLNRGTLRARLTQVMEGLDDAEHRAEEADEGRVAAQGSEEGEEPLVLGPLARHRRGDHFLHRVGAA